MTQTLPLPRLQHLLLDLLSPCRKVQQDQLDRLQADDWNALLDLMRQHRLAPLLHWQLRHSHGHLVFPADVLQDLARSYQQSTLRSLALQRELLLVHRVLDAAEIPHMALKGAYLAFHAYPHPALRPLRDLDILVPRDQTLRAYQVLLDGGLRRIEQYQGMPEATLDLSKHLPPLRSPSGSVNVELHSRLFTPHDDERATSASTAKPVRDLSEDPEFWQRSPTAEIAGAPLQFESPTDLLYHLIVHAAYDHEFNNGPLLLADLAFLLKRHAMDWPLLWSLASQGGHIRGCALALQLLQRYWGPQPVEWCGYEQLAGQIQEQQLENAAVLMLRDFEARGDVSLQTQLRQHEDWLDKTRYLLRKLFVPRAVMASAYPVAADDWRIYAWYPVRWYRLISERLPELLRSRQQSHLRHEVDQLTQLRTWLASSLGS